MKIHVVQKGETIRDIANEYDLSIEELKEMNRHIDFNQDLMPKMKVKVPLKEPVFADRSSDINVNDKRLAPPHNPDKPKALPRIAEDEYVFSDKLISSIDDDQDNEFIQQFLPEQYVQWDPNMYPQYMSTYEYPVQANPVPTDYRYAPYYNQYNYYPGNPYMEPYYQNYYRPYNPCGCGGYSY
ncbi:LysM peptidoglycan-binding domain-containing protein [Aquisalibacillus elongatus]|uniref:LysM domain-containing protein n=1 Tax=Aquisalibacillus elongatus TaxID=485577 RepID=A0A3N5C0C6_9BACI|nr:LysM peptidoglycan-binding domain-containing protein [Aquisalibacillus elongatus]RPF55508.1 LysM domain-containing protein [Aquisalibacillus elongatus]